MDANTPAHDTVLAAEQLDPGIADVVIMLRNLGFNPTDSGDGRSKPDADREFDVKHVACTWKPLDDGCTPKPGEAFIAPFDESRFFGEARRLRQVLGAGWSIQATFNPADQSYILLATKNEPPGPRHDAALTGWPFEAAGKVNRGSVCEQLYHAGCALHAALKHELGRR